MLEEIVKPVEQQGHLVPRDPRALRDALAIDDVGVVRSHVIQDPGGLRLELGLQVPAQVREVALHRVYRRLEDQAPVVSKVSIHPFLDAFEAARTFPPPVSSVHDSLMLPVCIHMFSEALTAIPRTGFVGSPHGVHDRRVKSSIGLPLQAGYVVVEGPGHMGEPISARRQLGLEHVDASKCALLLQPGLDDTVK